jgi:hypothetical protein
LAARISYFLGRKPQNFALILTKAATSAVTKVQKPFEINATVFMNTGI